MRIAELRNFGKGPSPKKKRCCNGFRPHLAWDLDTGCLIVAEFRKSSARGTSTVKGFTKDYLMPEFQNLFECVYLDSEYTGKSLTYGSPEAKNTATHFGKRVYAPRSPQSHLQIGRPRQIARPRPRLNLGSLGRFGYVIPKTKMVTPAPRNSPMTQFDKSVLKSTPFDAGSVVRL